ncbi:hypothetical protein GCM10010218_15610 [Streptomyces mashuensis]|uniref:Antibiotic biosynthesis monooxygenase n=1 Tax=Streptomyces mashuensis TaxID=33904 RepID=A0A919EC04_9ACTN|nr:hypothetical protein [Streptomyces mashuensis]GHF35271.1 hypothetical protein GCM10010218_15610 [Streptomyces mashuensis]
MTRLHELLHPSAGTILISEWLTGTTERARAAADAVAEEWAAGEAPPARLSQHMFVDTAGSGLLHYAQWTSDEDHLAWAREYRGSVISRVDTRVPGIERPGLNRTRLRRSLVHDEESPAGVLVVTMGRPDAHEEPVPQAPGLLAEHLHVTTDGERAIVFTEWTDSAAYEASTSVATATAADPYAKAPHAKTSHAKTKTYILHSA